MVSDKEFATALAVMSAMEVEDEVEKRFSEEERDLLSSWFEKIWAEEDDVILIEENMRVLEQKLKELKGN